MSNQPTRTCYHAQANQRCNIDHTASSPDDFDIDAVVRRSPRTKPSQRLETPFMLEMYHWQEPNLCQDTIIDMVRRPNERADIFRANSLRGTSPSPFQAVQLGRFFDYTHFRSAMQERIWIREYEHAAPENTKLDGRMLAVDRLPRLRIFATLRKIVRFQHVAEILIPEGTEFGSAPFPDIIDLLFNRHLDPEVQIRTAVTLCLYWAEEPPEVISAPLRTVAPVRSVRDMLAMLPHETRVAILRRAFAEQSRDWPPSKWSALSGSERSRPHDSSAWDCPHRPTPATDEQESEACSDGGSPEDSPDSPWN